MQTEPRLYVVEFRLETPPREGCFEERVAVVAAYTAEEAGDAVGKAVVGSSRAGFTIQRVRPPLPEEVDFYEIQHDPTRVYHENRDYWKVVMETIAGGIQEVGSPEHAT